MKHLLRGLGAAFIMLFVLGGSASAQTMVGLPQYGVTLSGTSADPVINNASGRDILAYTLIFRDAQGQGSTDPELTTGHIRRNEPVQTSIHLGRTAANQPSPPQTQHGAFVTVTLDSVVFADGEYVAASQQSWDGFQIFAIQIEAEKGLGQTLASTRNNPSQQNAAWAKVAALGEVPTEAEMSFPAGFKRGQQHVVARDILFARTSRGDDEAFNMAERSAKLPSLWRKK